LSVGANDFYFLLSLRQFSPDADKWPESQILIPDWTSFHCPNAPYSISHNLNIPTLCHKCLTFHSLMWTALPLMSGELLLTNKQVREEKHSFVLRRSEITVHKVPCLFLEGNKALTQNFYSATTGLICSERDPLCTSTVMGKGDFPPEQQAASSNQNSMESKNTATQ